MEQQVTQGIARFAARLRFENLDPSLIQKFKKYLLDGMGCGLYGRSLPWCQIVNRFIKEQCGKKESTLWLEVLIEKVEGIEKLGDIQDLTRTVASKGGL